MLKVNCLQCNKEATRYPSTLKSKVFCSRNCRYTYYRNDPTWANWNKGLIRSQETKDKIALKNKENSKGTKNPFYGKHHTDITKAKIRITKTGVRTGFNAGEKHYRWNPNREEVRQDRRNDPEYKQWRRKVWLRDNFKCKIANQDCKGRIEAHHILSWREHKELRYEINNGITLCYLHHPRKRELEINLSPYFQSIVMNIK